MELKVGDLSAYSITALTRCASYQVAQAALAGKESTDHRDFKASKVSCCFLYVSEASRSSSVRRRPRTARRNRGSRAQGTSRIAGTAWQHWIARAYWSDWPARRYRRAGCPWATRSDRSCWTTRPTGPTRTHRIYWKHWAARFARYVLVLKCEKRSLTCGRDSRPSRRAWTARAAW